MDLTQLRELLAQVQTGARVTTAIGDPVQVGNRVIIPVAEIRYGGGGGGGGDASVDTEHKDGCGCHGGGDDSAGAVHTDGASGGCGCRGAGAGARIRPLGCWIISPSEERWLPAVDVNRLILLIGGVLMLGLWTVRAIARHR